MFQSILLEQQSLKNLLNSVLFFSGVAGCCLLIDAVFVANRRIQFVVRLRSFGLQSMPISFFFLMFTYNFSCFRFFLRLELQFNLLFENSLTNFLVCHSFLVNKLELQLSFFHLKPCMLSTARKPKTFKQKRA